MTSLAMNLILDRLKIGFLLYSKDSGAVGFPWLICQWLFDAKFAQTIVVENWQTEKSVES